MRPTVVWLVLAATSCGRGEPPARSRAAPAMTRTPDDARVASEHAAPICPVTAATLGPGLAVERWPVAGTPAVGEPCIDVVRADLAHYRLRALTAEDGVRPAPAWRERFHLVAVTNAGMFHDTNAPVGLVIADGRQHGTDNPKFSGFIAWDPVSPKDAAVIAAGRTCAGFDLAALRKRYRSLLQSYRLLDCEGAAIAWQDPKQYSVAAVGVDRAGRVVFLHARAGFTMSQIATALGAHDLAGAVFLEGGPEASLVVHGPDGRLERVGSYETSFVENDGNTAFWDLPNVIALAPR